MTRKPILMIANWRPPRDPSFKDDSDRKFLREAFRNSPRALPNSIAPPSLFRPHNRSQSRSRFDRNRIPYYMELNKKHEIPVNTHGYTPTVDPEDLKYPVLEELMQMPILKTEGLRAEVLAELKDFRYQFHGIKLKGPWHTSLAEESLQLPRIGVNLRIH